MAVHKELKEFKALLELKGQLDHREFKERQVQLAPVAVLDPLDLKVQPDREEVLDLLDLKAQLDREAALDHRVFKVQPVLKEFKELKVFKERQELKVCKDPLVAKQKTILAKVEGRQVVPLVSYIYSYRLFYSPYNC